MKFYFGEFEWRIEETNEAFLLAELNKEKDDDVKYYAAFGLCDYKNHLIWLNKDICRDQKIHTLVHELTHCYLWSIGVKHDGYSEETLCNMMYGLITAITPVLNKWKEENK